MIGANPDAAGTSNEKARLVVGVNVFHHTPSGVRHPFASVGSPPGADGGVAVKMFVNVTASLLEVSDTAWPERLWPRSSTSMLTSAVWPLPRSVRSCVRMFDVDGEHHVRSRRLSAARQISCP